jgi:hypothetical protein
MWLRSMENRKEVKGGRTARSERDGGDGKYQAEPGMTQDVGMGKDSIAVEGCAVTEWGET